MNKVPKPLKAVYCYYFPEVRSIINEVVYEYPHEIFLRSINPGLDDFHEPVIDAYLKHFRSELPGLSKFPYRYVAGGASESIFHLLSYLKTNMSGTPLYVLKGEYEGYVGYGANLGLSFTVVDELTDLLTLPLGILFLSNPSARDGNIIPDRDILVVADFGHRVVYDATYVGLTAPHRFTLSHPNIIAVIVSLSKPFGLYYYRVGFAFTRFEIKTLSVNKWFKNLFSLIVAQKVLERINSKKLIQFYRSWQRDAVDRMNKEYGTNAQPSQVVLLASANSIPGDPSLSAYDRRSNYRYCLTPYFLTKERGFV